MEDQIKIEEVEVNQDLQILHSRKGLIHGRVVSISEEWITLKIFKPVDGLTSPGKWQPGEELSCRKSLIRNITKFKETV